MYRKYNQSGYAYNQPIVFYNGNATVAENVSDVFELFDGVISHTGDDVFLSDDSIETVSTIQPDTFSVIDVVLISVLRGILVQDIFELTDDSTQAVGITCGEELAFTDRYVPQRNINLYKRTQSPNLGSLDSPFLQSGKVL